MISIKRDLLRVVKVITIRDKKQYPREIVVKKPDAKKVDILV